MVFIPKQLADAPEIQALQQQAEEIGAKVLVNRLVSSDLTLGEESGFLLVDLTVDRLVTLPEEPLDPDPYLHHLLVINTLRGSGKLTVNPNGNPINGVQRSIVVPSERRLEITWIGGAVGWVTDGQYTNRALSRLPQLWSDPANYQDPDNLAAITDGNLGTQSGWGETDGNSGSRAIVFVDLDVVTEVSYVRATCFLRVRPFGWLGDPRRIGVAYSLDAANWTFSVGEEVFPGDFDSPSNVVFDSLATFTARYVGVYFSNNNTEELHFSVQELELA